MFINQALNYLYDFKMFWKWSAYGDQESNKTNLEALIQMDAHRLEKGLALNSPRPNFGTHVALRLVDNLTVYLSKFESNTIIQTAIDSLVSYERFINRKNQSDAIVSEKILQISQQLDKANQIQLGGVLPKTKDEIIADAKLDLKAFFYSRHSIRQFSHEEVSLTTIYEAIDIARNTPSVCNRQSSKVHIYFGDEILDILSLQNGNIGFREQVNKVLVVTSDLQNFVSAGERNQAWIDGGMFAMSLVYALHSLGLGTCCLNWSVESPADKELKRVTDIEEFEAVIMMIAVGHLKDNFVVAQSHKKQVDEISIIGNVSDAPNESTVSKPIIDAKFFSRFSHFVLRLLSTLFSYVVIVLGAFSRIINQTISNFTGQQSILILPPASPGSLGDEAVELAFLQQVQILGYNKIGIVSCNTNDNWEHLPFINENIDLSSFLNSIAIKNLARHIIKLAKFQHLSILGTDIMDGGYSDRVSLSRLRLAEISAKIGIRTEIVNFSLNSNPSTAVIHAFLNLPDSVRLVCRDPISQERLSNLINRQIDASADIAFLLPLSNKSPIRSEVISWIEEQKLEQRLVIGLNINPQVFGESFNDTLKEKLVSSYISLISDFGQNNKCSFVFLPHDFRQSQNDLHLSLDVITNLPADVQEWCKLPTIPYNTNDIKVISQHFDLIFSGRMHLAILGLSVGTPVACVTYQDKFEGLFRHFGLEKFNLTLKPIDTLDIDKLHGFIRKKIQDRESLRFKIQEGLPLVKNKAMNNLP